DGCPGVEDLAHQLGLDAREAQVRRVTALARGPAAEHLRAVAEHDDGDVSTAGGLDRSGDLRTVRAAELAALRVREVLDAGAQLVEDGRDLDPELDLGVRS